MVRSLEQLRDEKEALLRKERGKRSLDNLALRSKVERKRLKAEINALKNPKSQTAKRVARNLSLKSATLLFKGGMFLGKHLAKVAREADRPARKPTKKKTTKKKRK